jgi:hypothetical protein
MLEKQGVEWGKISYLEGLREEKNYQRIKTFIRDIKDRAEIVFEVKQIFRKQSYLGLPPTVDTALIPLCHTCFSKKTKCLLYVCQDQISYIYSDIISE